jgi:hypothetical protein
MSFDRNQNCARFLFLLSFFLSLFLLVVVLLLLFLTCDAAIAYGGVATLMTRMSIWVWLQYRLFWPEYHHAPSFLLYTGIPVTVGSLLLDLYWTRLYLSNFPAHKRAVAALVKRAFCFVLI